MSNRYRPVWAPDAIDIETLAWTVGGASDAYGLPWRSSGVVRSTTDAY